MLLQIILNFKESGCGTSSNAFQIAYVGVLFIRLFIDEFYNNMAIARRCWNILMIITSLIILGGLSAYEIYAITDKPDSFFWDSNNDNGNLVCYQNRIVFVTEVIVAGLIIVKDILVCICGKDNKNDDGV